MSEAIFPHVRIVAPVRDRAWVLAPYLSALLGLAYPKHAISLHFVVNDSLDASEAMLRDFAAAPHGYRSVRVDVIDRGRAEADAREQSVRQRTYPILASLRNFLFRSAAADATVDYVFSVDSDVILPADALQRLLDARRDVVAALVPNGDGAYNFLLRDPWGDLYRDANDPPTGVFPVAVTGAACLYSRAAFSAGVWSAGPSGEDAGLAASLHDHRIRLWVDGSTRADHMMAPAEA